MKNSPAAAPTSAHLTRMAHKLQSGPDEPGTDPLDGEYLTAFQRLVSEIFRINGTLLSVADRLARDLDITPARWQAIAVIQREPATVSEISRRLGIRRQSVQPTVNRMRDQGIVRLKRNPGHRRAPLVELTPFGQKIWTELLNRQEQLSHIFTRSIDVSAGDLDRLAGELRRLRRNAEHDK